MSRPSDAPPAPSHPAASKGALHFQGPGAGPSEGLLSAQNSHLQSRTLEQARLNTILKSLLQRKKGPAEGRIPTPTRGHRSTCGTGTALWILNTFSRVLSRGTPRLTPDRFQKQQMLFNGRLPSAAPTVPPGQPWSWIVLPAPRSPEHPPISSVPSPLSPK